MTLCFELQQSHEMDYQNRTWPANTAAFHSLSLLHATTCEDRVSHVVAGANERRLYSQAKPNLLGDEVLVYTRYLANMYFAQKPSDVGCLSNR